MEQECLSEREAYISKADTQMIIKGVLNHKRPQSYYILIKLNNPVSLSGISTTSFDFYNSTLHRKKSENFFSFLFFSSTMTGKVQDEANL